MAKAKKNMPGPDAINLTWREIEAFRPRLMTVASHGPVHDSPAGAVLLFEKIARLALGPFGNPGDARPPGGRRPVNHPALLT
jgi:hypothetical protein